MMKKKIYKAKKTSIVIPKCEFCTLYCGDCSYFNPSKTSYGKCWCGYYKMYSRRSSDLACNNFRR